MLDTEAYHSLSDRRTITPTMDTESYNAGRLVRLLNRIRKTRQFRVDKADAK